MPDEQQSPAADAPDESVAPVTGSAPQQAESSDASAEPDGAMTAETVVTPDPDA